jgi:hypothetical protein
MNRILRRVPPWWVGSVEYQKLRLSVLQRNPEVLLQPVLRFFKFLPGEERLEFLHHLSEKAS